MKFYKTVKQKQELDVKYVEIDIPILYKDEDMPYDFPQRGRSGGGQYDRWKAVVGIDTGKILGWNGSKDKTYEFCTKVSDSGTYRLLTEDMMIIAEIRENYVPNKLIPGGYGNYINLEINELGYITNWPQNPSLKEFDPEEN